jgi:hydroxypyruvate isomerase
MPNFAANLSMMYTEHDFLDRFAAASRDGFRAVEYLFPYAFDRRELAARLADHGLAQVLFNAPPGKVELDERGLACLPGREDEFRRAFVEQALPYAQALRCPRIHVMAGRVPGDIERAVLQATYVENLAWAAAQAAGDGVDVLIEPINTRDIPGYFLNRQDHAHEIVAEAGAPNLKVQMDLYHCQIVEGDVAMKLRRYLPTGRVGHLQIAGVPERHEPDVGELHHPYLFAVLDELGYTGHVGCEYRPRAGTSAGLGWFEPYRAAQVG